MKKWIGNSIFIIVMVVFVSLSALAIINSGSCLTQKETVADTNTAEIYFDCPCGVTKLGGTFIEPYYWFGCGKCGRVFTNIAKCKDVNEFYEFSNNR